MNEIDRLDRVVSSQTNEEIARQNIEPQAAHRIMEETSRLVSDIRDALRKNGTVPYPYGSLWIHQDFLRFRGMGKDSLGDWSVNRVELAKAARFLLERPWLRVDHLEWSIVDALAFDAILGVWEEIDGELSSILEGWAYKKAKGNTPRIICYLVPSIALVWMLKFLSLSAVGFWAYNNLYSTNVIVFWVIIGITFLVGIVWPARSRHKRQSLRSKAIDIRSKMLRAYTALAPGQVVSPYQIRNMMLYAQRHSFSQNTLWDQAALALLDRAITRDPPVWFLDN